MSGLCPLAYVRLLTNAGQPFDLLEAWKLECLPTANEELNAALRDFAVITTDRLTVVLRPGPGMAQSFGRERSIPFNWRLHLLGGISRHMSTLHLGNEIWDPTPYLHIHVDGEIDLKKLRIPKGVDVLEIADLQLRYGRSLQSADRTVRGWSCWHIARLDSYRVESMRKIVGMLNDSDDWVKLNAAGALSTFSEFSDEAIGGLEAVKTDDERLQDRIKKTIRALRTAESDPGAREEFRHQLSTIHEFTESLADPF